MANKKVLHIIFNCIYFVVLILCIVFTMDYINLLYEKRLVYEKQQEEENIIELSSKKTEYDLDYLKHYYNNNDIIGAIKIEGTKINNLIVKSTNNKYYLNHSLNKEYDERGSIFIDYRADLNSKQINIYGHNSNVFELPFKELEKYLDKEFYNSHKYVEIYDGSKKIYYEIFSVQIVTQNYEHMNIFPNDLQNHVNQLNESIYKTSAKATIDDDILVLQTCGYNPIGSLIIINSKKVREENLSD